MLSRFGQSNGDSLFSTLHLSSRSSAFQLAALKFVHRSLYIFLRLAAIFASHDFFLPFFGRNFGMVALWSSKERAKKRFPSTPPMLNLNC